MMRTWNAEHLWNSHLTPEENDDVAEAAHAALQHIDLVALPESLVVWHRGEWSGRPQVIVWPIAGPAPEPVQ